MKQDDTILSRDLVLIGGGHSHALVLRRWGMTPLPGVRLTVIDPLPNVAYSGMLPGFVAGHYRREELDIDLVRLAAFAGARLIPARATGLDLEAGAVMVEGRGPVAFDVASIDIGITSAMPDLPGFAEHGVPAKPLGAFATRWAAMRDGDGPVRAAVIGGGVAGAELSMAMAFALGARGEVSLIDRGPILSAMTESGAALVRARLAALGVTVHENAPVAEVTGGAVVLESGAEVASTFTVGAAGARPWPWLAETGLADDQGFLPVDASLRTRDPRIFAAGDCAEMTASPRPKAGVFAVRQAPVLFDNLRAALSDRPMRPYRPQKDYLKLVSLGGKEALAEKWGRARAGGLLWRWKDRIDRRFMDKLNDLPVMEPPPPPPVRATGSEAVKPMCAGCGAKVGKGALGEALAALPPSGRGDVEPLPGDDAALLRMGDTAQVITTDHLRAVTPDPVLMARIAAVHALGDIWAMGAAPQAALVSLILPRMTPALQSRTLSEIMAAAEEVLSAEGTAIVGGHTTMGDEMTIGFTLTGLVPERPVTLAGGRPGDALILTKPLGTGVILAGAMEGKVPGRHVLACLETMATPQGGAARALSGAHAMTDVTGFGLAGHLAGLCAASGCGAEIELAALPMLDGAEEAARAGVRSTLWEDNRTGAGPVFGADGPRGDLLFDPQTGGGLLAAVPEAEAGAVMAAIRESGLSPARIGRLVEGEAVIRCL